MDTYDDYITRVPDDDPEGEHQNAEECCPDCGAAVEEPCSPLCGCVVCRSRDAAQDMKAN